ncbi:ferritin-like domain-containing protein [Aspergillus fumigatus Af293]|uniref:Stress response protein Rds1, putative n=1 Tax=Aspergillus fumigatus (strain ATCC MYA-4609 / CBS 101355 / FGSC A1100 / Af293) TaxID=330879 RepID=Q4WVL1_ASPFU|nr:stress response protein Rds1, putative [Aspergillus fumigatus Af293]EAL91365.1 stress response protein Rds1, putative [Aspergillus fumigatus Af293]
MNWRHFLLINVLGGLPYTFAGPNVRRADGPSSEPPILSHTTSLPHSSYTATPTTSGAERASSVGSGISTLGPAPGATSYPSDGKLHDLQPAPFTPAGGVGTNGTTPISNAKSDFDYESLVGFYRLAGRTVADRCQALVLYQEYIELDLFHDGLARFSVAEFTAAGLTAEDRFLIEFMADQEAGHATMLTNILGDQAPRQCVYNYPYATVHEFIDFCQKLTRFGEAGVYGFLPHLDSREAAGLLTQTVTTEARQQMIFRQFEGLFPMPVWFEVGVPQSWAWTLLAPYISYCPANQTRLAWQNFPSLYIENQPNPYRVNGSSSVNETLADGGMNTLASRNVTGPESCLNKTAVGESCSPAITHNRTSPLSYPGRTVTLSWDAPGKGVGPNNSYITNTTAGCPSYVLWASQLNVTYSTLTTSGNSSYGTTIQPDLSTYAGDPALNGTIFIAITDTDLFVTPFNISSINPHIVAGPALYQAG